MESVVVKWKAAILDLLSPQTFALAVLFIDLCAERLRAAGLVCRH
jgi:hypothetical protein